MKAVFFFFLPRLNPWIITTTWFNPRIRAGSKENTQGWLLNQELTLLYAIVEKKEKEKKKKQPDL